jgi:hypothetical protein
LTCVNIFSIILFCLFYEKSSSSGIFGFRTQEALFSPDAPSPDPNPEPDTDPDPDPIEVLDSTAPLPE